MKITIGSNSKIVAKAATKPVRWAIEVLKRDIETAFIGDQLERNDIFLVKKVQEEECYCIIVDTDRIEIHAADDLGFIYGLYHVSRVFLGIHDLWFWNDQKITQRDCVEIPDDYKYQSHPFAVRNRGWFVNDEVLLHTWTLDGDKDKPWEMVFEALLRLGGNMVIPGTDRNGIRYRKLAAGMGLKITHHHAEPLGAEMFARAYPDLNPSYDEHPDKFQQLWIEAIEKQKDFQVVWNLGFRGQGDCPFWENDPRYQTDMERGKLISELIEVQYNLVKERIPDAVCCTNIYGETMELYQGGFLSIPEGVVKIWADNGYGKMVSRRLEKNYNPRIPSLPEEKDGCHGIYYHVSYFDLLAGSHITMLPNSPVFIQQELQNVLQAGVKDYWVINGSNVKPHVYYLSFIARIWRTGKIDIESYQDQYVKDYYGKENADDISKCFKEYFKSALAFGFHEDEHAGEQFPNHNVRGLISSFMKNQQEPSEQLQWLQTAKTFAEQVKYFGELFIKGEKQYSKYLEMCSNTAKVLSQTAAMLLQDTLLLQAQIHYYSYHGALLATRSLETALAGDYQTAFYYAGRAKEEYLLANELLRGREHDKWQDFYENECLTDMKWTAVVLGGYMSYLRIVADSPYFYKWQREFLYSEDDRRVVLITNMENHISDEEMYSLMKLRRED